MHLLIITIQTQSHFLPSHLLLLQGFLGAVLGCCYSCRVVHSLCKAHRWGKHLKVKNGKTKKRFLNESHFEVGEVNAELTLSTRAAGLVEKPKRSFTDALEGFCTKGLKKRRKSVFIHTSCRSRQICAEKVSVQAHRDTHTYFRGDTGILGGLRVYSEKGSQAIFDRLL